MRDDRKVRLRPEIGEFAQVMERRMRGRHQESRSGEIVHYRQMDVEELLASSERNLNHLREGPTNAFKAFNDAADAANFAMFAALRIALEE